MRVDAASLDADETYRLLSSVVVPRPIAWITSVSPEGVVNLAPFSCFTFVSNRPPLIGVTIGRKGERRKDTGANIHAAREFVINIGDSAQMEQIHLSSTEHPFDVSEVDLLGLRTEPSIAIRCPRLADAPVAMECRLHRVVEFGVLGSEFVVGEIVQFHFREGLYRDGRVETAELRPVCRLGGPNYATLGPIVALKPIALTPRSTAVDIR